MLLPLWFVVVALLPAALTIFPIPQQFSQGNSTVTLSPSFYIDITFSNPPGDLEQAVNRSKNWVYSDKSYVLEVSYGADWLKAHPPKAELCKLKLYLNSSDHSSIYDYTTSKKAGEKDESYYLSVPDDGSDASLTANNALGLLRGLTTFEQLWYTSPSDSSMRFAPYTPVEITDYPWFPWRGFGLDTSRNYIPVPDLIRQIDAMLMSKLSVFYWHIVDSQSFPLSLPNSSQLSVLSQNGAYAPMSIYTPNDIQNIVVYAGVRGIDVVMEIDTPGHTDAIALSYPDLVACHERTPWSTYANEPPAGQLRFMLPEATSLIVNLFDTLTKLLPSRYFSTGGDEINFPCYTNDTVSQANLNSTGRTFEQALSNFTVASHNALSANGKTPMVWEEMVNAHNVTLQNDTLVIVWISSQSARGVVEEGYHVVHAPTDHFYLDCGHGGWVGNFTGPSYCSFVSWQLMYSFDPYANITSENEHLVVGGQAMMWCEQTDNANLDDTVWPRAAANAGLWWLGGPAGSYPLDGQAALPQIHDLRYRMVDRGIRAIPLQPLWCALRPGACDLLA